MFYLNMLVVGPVRYAPALCAQVCSYMGLWSNAFWANNSEMFLGSGDAIGADLQGDKLHPNKEPLAPNAAKKGSMFG